MHERASGGAPPRHPGDRIPRQGAPGGAVRLTGILFSAALLVSGALLLTSARPRLRPPRDPLKISAILSQSPHAGDCERCHTAHAGGQPAPQPKLLLGPNDNSLCLGCHDTGWAGGSFGGPALYAGSAHGSSRTMVWPGSDPPGRIEPDAPGKCLNCHDPHGWPDAGGLVPHLALQREEKLCLTCHDGSPAATNVNTDARKPFRHPVTDYTGRHTGATESRPGDFGVAPVNRRHAECEDCHNGHLARPDPPLGPAGGDASKTTLGVSRVAVLNGPAGSAPTYTFIPGADTLSGSGAEHELCFKCHSSWTTQPAGQADLARALNPANPSYHPVETPGRNPGIHPLAFTAGWDPSSITRCGDCHGSDFGTTKGPHGSIYRYILRKPYAASPSFRAASPEELCFACHSYDVYANPGAPEGTRAYSRFNRPNSDKGHAEHVGEAQVPCYACHVTHGSTTQPHLIATGRAPGITTYTATSSGGTCAPTCHGARAHTVNYAR